MHNVIHIYGILLRMEKISVLHNIAILHDTIKLLTCWKLGIPLKNLLPF